MPVICHSLVSIILSFGVCKKGIDSDHKPSGLEIVKQDLFVVIKFSFLVLTHMPIHL